MNILKGAAVIFLLWTCISVPAQILNPAKWKFSVQPVKDDEYEFVAHCTIEPGWHLYSTREINGDGPIPTSFRFESSPYYQLKGNLNESRPIIKKEPVFDNIELAFFENKATFRQRIKILQPASHIVFKGEVEFMLCNETQCLPPDVEEFTLIISYSGQTGKGKNVRPVLGGDASSSVTLNDTAAKKAITVNDDKNEEGRSQSGILEPVKWQFRSEKISQREYLIIAEAQIEKGWHIYSMKQESEEGPVPTKITITEQRDIELAGDATEEGPVQHIYDPNYLMNLAIYEGNYILKQKIKLTGEKGIVKGTITYMACDEKRCLPPDDVEFYFEFPESSRGTIASATTSEFDSNVMGFWELFFLSFAGGLVVLFTPCVFPMIPLTVSFFTKQSKSRVQGIRHAFLYGISIIIIYVILGTAVTALFGFDALNAMSTNFWFNIFFFLLLLIFGVSFLGAFEIVLPASWTNKVSALSDKGGWVGIFFMAFTLALVSFSCTGPVVGPLLVQAASTGGMGPVIGMFGFSFALALPFALFAAFPGWLQSLPKSGGWMVSVKVFLGFLEIAFALKFLSNADLVIQAGWITREVFIALWIAIFLTLALYLFGFVRLPHDEKIENISVFRAVLGIVTLAFVLYMIPGLWGAPLKLISGFPPPAFYSESPDGVGRKGSSTLGEGKQFIENIPIGAEPEHCPHALNCFHDYDKGLQYARQVKKPILIDFTGWACVNCRKMEENVWSDPRVLEILRNQVVLISLYVDDKRELPAEEQFEAEMAGRRKKIKTIGNKWSWFQAQRYGTNSQPYYVMMDLEENTLYKPTGYEPDVEAFLLWLKEGISQFHRQKSL